MKTFSALQFGKIKFGLRYAAGDSIVKCSEFYGTDVWDSIPRKGMDYYCSSYLSRGLSTGDNAA